MLIVLFSLQNIFKTFLDSISNVTFVLYYRIRPACLFESKVWLNGASALGQQLKFYKYYLNWRRIQLQWCVGCASTIWATDEKQATQVRDSVELSISQTPICLPSSLIGPVGQCVSKSILVTYHKPLVDLQQEMWLLVLVSEPCSQCDL